MLLFRPRLLVEPGALRALFLGDERELRPVGFGLREGGEGLGALLLPLPQEGRVLGGVDGAALEGGQLVGERVALLDELGSLCLGVLLGLQLALEPEHDGLLKPVLLSQVDKCTVHVLHTQNVVVALSLQRCALVHDAALVA